jgi:uncharacterized protein (AIM24 family)
MKTNPPTISVFLWLLLLAPVLHAANLTVTTEVDEFHTPSGGLMSLREALRDAADNDTIVFAPSLNGKIIPLALANKDIVIDKNLTINASSLAN